MGSIATLITGSGKIDRLQPDRAVGRGERVAGHDLLDPDRGGDIAGVDLLQLLALVGVHHQDPADPLGPTGVHVQHARSGSQLARVDAEVGQLADVWVGHDLERERRERLVVGRVAARRLAIFGPLDGLQTLDRRHVERARQVVDHRVEQRLHALVLEARAAQHRRHPDRQRRRTDRLLEARSWNLLLLEDHLEQLIVVVRDLLQQVLAGGSGVLGELRRNLDHILVLAELVLVDDRDVLDQVDDPAEAALGADRKLDRYRVRTEAVDHRLHTPVEVGADPVHLVDVRDPRHAVLVSLAPDGL